jgi:putative transposase
MKKNRYTEEQIIGMLKQHEAGVKTADLCREHGISAATFYGWKSKFGGMDVSEAQRLKAMEEGSRRQQPPPPIRPDAQDVQVHGLRRRHQSPATHDEPNARPPKVREIVLAAQVYSVQ